MGKEQRGTFPFFWNNLLLVFIDNSSDILPAAGIHRSCNSGAGWGQCIGVVAFPSFSLAADKKPALAMVTAGRGADRGCRGGCDGLCQGRYRNVHRVLCRSRLAAPAGKFSVHVASAATHDTLLPDQGAKRRTHTGEFALRDKDRQGIPVCVSGRGTLRGCRTALWLVWHSP